MSVVTDKIHELIVNDRPFTVYAPISTGTPYGLVYTPSSRRCIVMFLLKYIDIDSISKCDSTALHVAAFSENYPLIKTLIKYDANATLKNKLGKTALNILEDKSDKIFSK